MKNHFQAEKRILIFAAFLPLALALAFAAFLFFRAESIKNAAPGPLPKEEASHLQENLGEIYPKQILRPLPYSLLPPEFDTNARSAILINANTGEILFEKNADAQIPPASMTKLFLIYGALKKVLEGKISLDDIIPIDERAIAAAMPPRSSLMFLGKGQIVTLRELLQGLSVASGNDAAHQIAFALYGSMENFIEETNALIKSLGLQKTRIVESSGYSEENLTTAREMAAFCKIYLEEFPDALEEFHSIKRFVFPKEKNIPNEQRGRTRQDFSHGIPEEIWTSFTLENTNKLLGRLEGCDGIKTGHIDESGYNLALTTIRGGVRYISVTMKGPGATMAEGDEMRCADGTVLHEWAHGAFCEIAFPEKEQFNVPLYGAKEKSVALCAAFERDFVVPKNPIQMENGIFAAVAGGAENGDVSFKVFLPEFIFGKVECCAPYGKIVASKNGIALAEIPLVAQRGAEDANGFVKRCDALILKMKNGRY